MSHRDTPKDTPEPRHTEADGISAPASARAVVEEVLSAAGWSFATSDDQDGWTTYVTPVGEAAVEVAVARVSEELERFALYLVFAPEAAPARCADVSELITRINWGLGDGNFEMDYDTGEVRFKIAVDFSGVPLSPLLVRNALLDSMDVLEVYGGAVLGVMAGEVSAREALSAAEA